MDPRGPTPELREHGDIGELVIGEVGRTTGYPVPAKLPFKLYRHDKEKVNDMLLNAQPGAPVEWTIGPAGQAADTWAARLANAPKFGTDDRGREGEVVTIITLQKNLAGEEFLGERTVQARFLFDRTYRVEQLDGTADKPKTIQELIMDRQNATKEFLATRAATQSLDALAAGLDD